MTEPIIATSDAEIAKCFAVVSELRTHLKEGDFVAMVRHMETEGYNLAYIEDSGTVVAVAGYRIFTSLFTIGILILFKIRNYCNTGNRL